MHQAGTVATLQSFTFGLFGYLYIGPMQRLQAFKFELMPRSEQQRDMHRFAGSCRFVYNKALALQIENYEAGGKFISYVAMAKRLTEWRNGPGTPWLKDSPVHPLQHALKNLARAYKNFFAKRAAHPCFKKKGQRDSFRYNGPGIAPAERDAVFRRFYRGESGQSVEGTGLGLSIVREIARLHGATVVLGDTVGGGLTVSVCFGAAEDETEPLAAA